MPFSAEERSYLRELAKHVAEIARRCGRQPEDITIVMLSAKGQEGDIEMGKSAGADDYFTKPFSPIALIEKVEEVMNRTN